MEKRRIVKEDGRYLIFYSFKTLSGNAAGDGHQAASVEGSEAKAGRVEAAARTPAAAEQRLQAPGAARPTKQAAGAPDERAATHRRTKEP